MLNVQGTLILVVLYCYISTKVNQHELIIVEASTLAPADLITPSSCSYHTYYTLSPTYSNFCFIRVPELIKIQSSCVMNAPFGTYLGASISFSRQFTSHVVLIVLCCIVTCPLFTSTIAPIVPMSLLSCTLLFSFLFLCPQLPIVLGTHCSVHVYKTCTLLPGDFSFDLLSPGKPCCILAHQLLAQYILSPA